MHEAKPPQFNLIDEPWIPCLMLDGRQLDLSLYDAVIRAQEVKEVFDQSPLITAGIYRLLLAVSHRCFPISSLSEWKTLWNRGEFDHQHIEVYLATYHERFDLYDKDRPFYQRASFTAKKTTPMKRLGWEFAAGNNATLLDHSLDVDRPPIKPALAAQWVIATQCFAASAGKSETLHTKDSPMTRGAVIILQGDNLFETLMLNLLNLHRPDFLSFDEDTPTWEREEEWQPGHNQTPNGKLEYLSWQSRSIRLLPLDDGTVSECYFAQGRALTDDWRKEPSFAYKRDDKQGLFVWQFNEDRAVWRDSHALFNLSQDSPFQIPQGLRHLATLSNEGFLDSHRMYQLQILGQSLKSGQPTIHFWRQERLPIKVEYLNQVELLERLRKALALAEETAKKVQQSLWALARLLLAPLSDNKEARQPDKKDIGKIVDSFGAIPHYWSQLEAPFKRLLLDLPQDQRVDQYGDVYYGEKEIPIWARTLEQSALQSFGIASRSLDNSARALKAVAIVEPQLRGKLRETLADYLSKPSINGGQK